MSGYHIPVLLKESIEGLNVSPGGIYVDATYGGGGHSSEILKRLGKGRLYALDQDEDSSCNLAEDNKFVFILGNFRFLKNYLNYYGVRQIDGLLADLGVSSHHFNTPERGFTYRSEAALDMRMNRNGKLTAEMVINEYEVSRLINVFRNYGELQHAHKLAQAIERDRVKQRIVSVSQLINCIEPYIPARTENQFLSKIFQAIRIEVNHELENLEEMLINATEMLKSGGRLVVISYHSLEDRIVKNFMRWGNASDQPAKDIYGNSNVPFRIVTRKPIVAQETELNENPRARSAKLRIAEKK